MLKEIFLPARFGNYFLFTERIVGISLNATEINAARIRCTGKSIVVEEILQQELYADQSVEISDQIINALKEVKIKFGKAQVRLSLSNHLVIFKQITVPFVDEYKIRKILGFELSPTLSFSLDDAIIDFIVLKKDVKNSSSTLLAAIIQKKHIARQLAYCEEAGITVQAITVDFIAFYGLYKSIPMYLQRENPLVLIEINETTTVLGQCYKGDLSQVITIPYGSFAMKDPAQCKEFVRSLMVAFRSGKLNGSFVALIPTYTQELLDILHTQVGIEGELFEWKADNTTQSSLLSCAAAYNDMSLENFTLMRNEYAYTDQSLLRKQLLVAGILISASIGMLLWYRYSQINQFSQAIMRARTTAVKQLKDTLHLQEKSSVLKTVIKTAQETIEKEEAIWFALSKQRRSSFIKYLKALSNTIDPKRSGLTLTRLSMNETRIELSGRVDNVYLFEQELNALEKQKNLFKYVGGNSIEEHTFNDHIIMLNNTIGGEDS